MVDVGNDGHVPEVVTLGTLEGYGRSSGSRDGRDDHVAAVVVRRPVELATARDEAQQRLARARERAVDGDGRLVDELDRGHHERLHVPVVVGDLDPLADWGVGEVG